MPRQYEAIRDGLVAKGMPLKDAKKHAAMIYNSKHHDNPVTNHSDPDNDNDYDPPGHPDRDRMRPPRKRDA